MRSVDDLIDLYFNSVGQNGKLLLNVPPTPAGLFHELDVARISEWRSRLSTLFAADLVRDARPSWQVTAPRTARLTVVLPRPPKIGVARLSEDIGEHGQLVAKHSVYGQVGSDWRLLASGSTIGYTRLHRFAPGVLQAVRVVVEDAAASPERVRLSLYIGDRG